MGESDLRLPRNPMGGATMRAAVTGHDGGEDSVGAEHGVEQGGRLAHDLVGHREAREVATLAHPGEQGLDSAFGNGDHLVVADGHERGVLVGD